jgi:hypothetical protein
MQDIAKKQEICRNRYEGSLFPKLRDFVPRQAPKAFLLQGFFTFYMGVLIILLTWCRKRKCDCPGKRIIVAGSGRDLTAGEQS